MNHDQESYRGSITVFLSMCLLCVTALLCVMVEQARMEGSRCYFQMAVNASLDTLLSQYHRTLWEKYRIFGLPYEGEADLIRRVERYVGRYLEVENWYPMQLDYIGVSACNNLTDQGGDFVTREILDYMTYDVWNVLEFLPEEGETRLAEIQEAASSGTIAAAYDLQEKDVSRVEETAKKLFRCVEQQDLYARMIADALESDQEGEFYEQASLLRREIRRYDSLLATYERQLTRLGQSVDQGEQLFGTAREDFQENREEIFEAQQFPYLEYEDAARAHGDEFQLQKVTSHRNLELLQETQELVRQLEEEYEERSEDEEEMVEELSLDLAAMLWEEYAVTALHGMVREGDEEKKTLLEQAREWLGGDLMSLVLPEDMEISKQSMPKTVQEAKLVKGKSVDLCSAAEKVLVSEYCSRYFQHARSKGTNPLQYELEYLLQGQPDDRVNLQETLVQLFRVRQGLNLIHILSDSGKRNEADQLAIAITGVVGALPLTRIVSGIIMVVWAQGEAVSDLRILMKGGRIPLWKTSNEWKLSLKGLLYGELTSDEQMTAWEDEETGLEYEGYLKLLLLLEQQEVLQERLLRVLQMNLQSEDAGISLDQCAYQVDIQGTACGKSVFLSLPLVDNFIYGADYYMLRADAQKRY